MKAELRCVQMLCFISGRDISEGGEVCPFLKEQKNTKYTLSYECHNQLE